ncbi:GNAT family N-acetyltransferase [Isoptericola croceus]|uniref:GNAT family N-acetyltransferase n=1 Tax=Isoptericola croceus TaxID=3031406 RepID=UPI0023F6BBAF|nr:GNAT family N-acetyltransferase [Isoptericola croceus]
MTEVLTDTTGARVTVGVELADPVSAYTITVDDGPVAGRAEFVDLPDADRERIIFHTEVDQDFSGRGLAKILLAEALADSIRHGLTIVPVCPLFSRHLARHGDEFLAAGGSFRTPTRADLSAVTLAVRHRP